MTPGGDLVRLTLERPWPKSRDGSLSIRFGTSPATRNPLFDGNRPEMGPPFNPGDPVIYGPIFAGDAERDSIIMPLEVARWAFGFWDVPASQEPRSVRGMNRGDERARMSRTWGDYKMVPHNGNMMPDLTHIGPPDFPFVAIRFLNTRGDVIVDETTGHEIVVRPREVWGFDLETYATHNQKQQDSLSEVESLKMMMLEQQRQIAALIANQASPVPVAAKAAKHGA